MVLCALLCHFQKKTLEWCSSIHHANFCPFWLLSILLAVIHYWFLVQKLHDVRIAICFLRITKNKPKGPFIWKWKVIRIKRNVLTHKVFVSFTLVEICLWLPSLLNCSQITSFTGGILLAKFKINRRKGSCFIGKTLFWFPYCFQEL